MDSSSYICDKEPKQFNELLNHLYELCRERNLAHFLKHFKSKITLIPKSEAADRFVVIDRIFNFVVYLTFNDEIGLNDFGWLVVALMQ